MLNYGSELLQSRLYTPESTVIYYTILLYKSANDVLCYTMILYCSTLWQWTVDKQPEHAWKYCTVLYYATSRLLFCTGWNRIIFQAHTFLDPILHKTWTKQLREEVILVKEDIRLKDNSVSFCAVPGILKLVCTGFRKIAAICESVYSPSTMNLSELLKCFKFWMKEKLIHPDISLYKSIYPLVRIMLLSKYRFIFGFRACLYTLWIYTCI